MKTKKRQKQVVQEENEEETCEGVQENVKGLYLPLV